MAVSSGWQTDYLYFFSVLAFFLLSAVCFSISKAEKRRYPWDWLGLFAVAFGLSQFIDLVALSQGSGAIINAFRLLVVAASFTFLAGFAWGVTAMAPARRPGIWVVAVLLALAAPGMYAAGQAGLITALYYYIIGPGVGLRSSLALFAAARKTDGRASLLWLTSAGAALGIFSAAAAFATPVAPFFPASIINSHSFAIAAGAPIQLFLGASALWAAASIWIYWHKRSVGHIGPHHSLTRIKYAALTSGALLAIFILGWVLAQYLDRHSRQTLVFESEGITSALANQLAGELSLAERSVVALARDPLMAQALLTRSEANINPASIALDQFQSAFNASVCYLLDKNGETVASSNRYSPDSFVGKNYGFRPYFKKAIDGVPGNYFAMGVTSGERGYYTSHPVRVQGGDIVGVAVVKKYIQNVESEFRRYPYCFLIDENGIAFLSSKPEMIFTKIWSLKEDVQNRLVFSRQFGSNPTGELLTSEAMDGSNVTINDRHYLVTRKIINPDRWSIILFTPMDRILADRLLGIIAALSLSVLTLAFFVSSQRMTEISAQIAASEANYRAIFNAANDAIFIHDKDTGDILDVNHKMSDMYGYDPEEARRIKLDAITSGTPPYTFEEYIKLIKNASEGEPQLFEWLSKDRSGRLFWVEVSLRHAVIGNKERILAVVRDISGRKLAENALRDSEARYRTIFENTGTALAIVEDDATLSLVNAEFAALSGYSKDEIEGKRSFVDFAAPEERERMTDYHYARRIDSAAAPRSYEFIFVDRNGSRRSILIIVAIIPGTKRSVISLLDITERKAAEEKLKHLSQHDPLTGLYNRASFEEAMRRIELDCPGPVGIILCDVDGLKLVNDSLGHEAGDVVLIEAAWSIKKCFRDFDMVARIGGDEFAVLLPGSDYSVVEKATHRIMEAVALYNQSNSNSLLSMSIGFAVRYSPEMSMADLFKEADNNMYKEKFNSSRSARSTIVKTLMKALEARDVITENHADRLQGLVADLAHSIGLPDHRAADLRLLARFHDIGKVGIPDRILFKPGVLTTDEVAEMRRHSEIGHRIAQSVPELASIADLILKHHEWWNGQGYPLGLKGEDIPLECRIIAIVDAYDAMTSNRPYRKAQSHSFALEEIIRCSGTQFDPHLVNVLTELLEIRACGLNGSR